MSSLYLTLVASEPTWRVLDNPKHETKAESPPKDAVLLASKTYRSHDVPAPEAVAPPNSRIHMSPKMATKACCTTMELTSY